MTAAADRHLLFGLLALQNGIINQGQLLAAFQAWTLDKMTRLADNLVARGDLTSAKRGVLDALAAVHVEGTGATSRRAWRRSRPTAPLAPAWQAWRAGGRRDLGPGRPEQGRPGHRREDNDPDRTASIGVGTTTSDGQRFRILRPHARGGLGVVFVALDSELNREVALKQILEKHADDHVSRHRFIAEAEITGGLEHPGVVPVYGLGTDAGGRPYYAMRFIKGDSLKEAIDVVPRGRGVQGRPRPPVAGAAQAVAAVHGCLQRHRLRALPWGDPPRLEAGQHHRGQAR